MSNTAFVYLYFNIGSEMVFIVQNRLRAQNICHPSLTKVLDDLLIEMFNEKFIDEAFQCERLPNLQSLKQLITKLVHCSIMKLNTESMNKLFDLIIMVFKYQLCACTHSSDLIQITLNHLNSLTEVTDKQPIKLLIALTRARFLNGPAASTIFKIQFTRQTLLNYLIGMRIRAAILLRIGAQCEDGRFRQQNAGEVACHCQLPGKITQFDAKGQVISIQNFPTNGHYEFDPSMTTLGFNIYEREEELSEKFKKETIEETDENNNCIAYDQQNKLQFRKEAQLLAAILGHEQREVPGENKAKLENQSDIDLSGHSSLIKKEKKNSKFWLNIDLELEDALESPIEAAEEANPAEEPNGALDKRQPDESEIERQELAKLEQAFGHQKLENKENPNHRVNLLKIKQQMEMAQEDAGEPNLLELLDAEC